MSYNNRPGDKDKSEHFVAHLKIERVERTVDRNTGSGKRERVVDEVTQFTIKDNELSVLVRRLGLHMELISRFPEDEKEPEL